MLPVVAFLSRNILFSKNIAIHKKRRADPPFLKSYGSALKL